MGVHALNPIPEQQFLKKTIFCIINLNSDLPVDFFIPTHTLSIPPEVFTHCLKPISITEYITHEN